MCETWPSASTRNSQKQFFETDDFSSADTLGQRNTFQGPYDGDETEIIPKSSPVWQKKPSFCYLTTALQEKEWRKHQTTDQNAKLAYICFALRDWQYDCEVREGEIIVALHGTDNCAWVWIEFTEKLRVPFNDALWLYFTYFTEFRIRYAALKNSETTILNMSLEKLVSV